MLPERLLSHLEVQLPDAAERPSLPLPQVTQLEPRAFPEPGAQPVLSHPARS